MEKIEAYKTKDGKVFEHQMDAIIYERLKTFLSQRQYKNMEELTLFMVDNQERLIDLLGGI